MHILIFHCIVIKVIIIISLFCQSSQYARGHFTTPCHLILRLCGRLSSVGMSIGWNHGDGTVGAFHGNSRLEHMGKYEKYMGETCEKT